MSNKQHLADHVTDIAGLLTLSYLASQDALGGGAITAAVVSISLGQRYTKAKVNAYNTE